MKKSSLILILVFVGINALFAQINATTEDGKKVILNSDYTWKFSTEKAQKMGIPDFDGKSFYWKNGYDKLVEVMFTNLLAGDKTMDKAIFQTIVIKSMVNAKASLVNSLSFVPIEFIIMLDDSAGYVTKVTFYGKNAYGVESEESSIFFFDFNGELK